MATTTWNPPLPPGFEARWDPNQRAYFYINHSTKTTTWQDPRFSQQPVAGYQATGGYQASGGYQAAGGNYATGHQAAAQTLNSLGYGGQSGGNTGHKMTTINKQFGSTISRSQGSDADTEGESDEDFGELYRQLQLVGSSESKLDVQKLHQIKQTFPSAPEDVIKELLLRKQNSVVQVNNSLFEMGYKRETPGAHPPPRQVDMAERIRAMFPSVPPNLVHDILDNCNHDEKKARQQLEDLGYKPTFPATHKDAIRPKSGSTSPFRHPSPKPRVEQSKPKPSQHAISRMENKLISEFELVDREMMQTALQICDYDEEKTRVMLGGMMDEARSKNDTSRTVSRSRSPSPTPFVSPALLEPQSMADDGYNEGPSISMDNDIPSFSFSASDEPFDSQVQRPSSSRGSTPLKTGSDAISRPSTSKSSRPVSPKRSPSPKPPPSPKKKTSPPKQKSHQQRAKQVTHRKSPTPVVAQQPRPSDYTSEYRTSAKGPDRSLPNGPNKELLLSEYSQAKGHNPELRVGPDSGRVQGPQGSSGPNYNLHCGPAFKETRSGHSFVVAI